VSIFEDERLRDQASCELRRRAADAEHVGRQSLMIGRVAHFGEPRE